MNRRFDPQIHIQSLSKKSMQVMYDDTGRTLLDIKGVGGAHAVTADGAPLGVDQITMWPGSAFPLHTHEGDHLLYVLSGTGALHVDGVDYVLREGDSVYVPANFPHAVRGPADGSPVHILAFGIPHHPIDATTRMQTVRDVATGTRAE
jgi:quercetin dioxygenase-like cupin family protein